MRNFEIPKMNISMFETENVVTVSSGATSTTNKAAAQEALGTAIGGNAGAGRTSADNIFEFNY